jgi:hypothetical protein
MPEYGTRAFGRVQFRRVRSTDVASHITATDCTLDGPYSPGVVIVNNAP